MCPDKHGSYIDLGSNPNLVTLFLWFDPCTPVPQSLIRTLSSLVTPKLQQVTLDFVNYSDSQNWDHWLEIDRILNGLASVRAVKIVLDDNPALTSTFNEYFPLLWSRGILTLQFEPCVKSSNTSTSSSPDEEISFDPS
jgi:hypothetical protein